MKKLAQSKLVDPKDILFVQKKLISDATIEKLKSTKTVFFYKTGDTFYNDSLKRAITDGWNFTEIVFDGLENFSVYANDPDYSYFIIQGVNTTTTTSTIIYESTHYYLALHLFGDGLTKGGSKISGLCRIELYPNFETMGMGSMGNNAEKVVGNLYGGGVFYNWSPVLLKAKLAAVSTNLNNHVRPWIYQNIKDRDLKKSLKSDTLYVPRSVLMSFNKFSGKENNASENIFSTYRYNYRICSDAELFQIFETEKRGRLLFEYVKSSTDKFITVYDTKNKKILYKKYKGISYNLKSGDINDIK